MSVDATLMHAAVHPLCILPAGISVFYLDQPDIFWLSIVNLLLGVIVLGCLAVLSFVVAREVLAQISARRKRQQPRPVLRILTRFGVNLNDECEQPDERVLHPGRIPEKAT